MADITFAEPPYHQDSGGDIILLSSDDVAFCVSKFILSLASPFFETMFKLPQPKDQADEGSSPGANTVHFQEDQRALYLILRTSYPGRSPKLSDISDLHLALRLDNKYGIDALRGMAEDALNAMLHSDPVGVYALASCYQLDEFVERSAKFARKLQLDDLYSDELSSIDAKQYHALISYHRRCSVAACGVGEFSWRWLGERTSIGTIFAPTPVWVHFKTCGCYPVDSTYKLLTHEGPEYKGTHWWRRYIDLSKAALKTWPCGDAVIDEKLLSRVLADARECEKCKRNINDDPDCLKVFSVKFAAEIERVVAEVSFAP
ncbi:hypothetical protein EWM64_g6893 [Hericium alpestre]|uniref:BTB domain-containing protein n=1 Tax=Hericium alpestre TaxID=135208 RepID=A0A4Y9ZRA5_9AGAM|nr:hypothetical protein EWM64_g6893 [Hericium alpestre]